VRWSARRAMISSGSGANRKRDHDALAHARRRIRADRHRYVLSGAGNADLGQKVDGALAGHRFSERLRWVRMVSTSWSPIRYSGLRAGERILKNHPRSVFP